MKNKKQQSSAAGFFAALGDSAEAFVRFFAGRAAMLTEGVELTRSGGEGDSKLKRRVYYAVLAAASFVLAAIIARADYPLGTHPAGLALLCAVGTGGFIRKDDLHRLNSDGIILLAAAAGTVAAALSYGDEAFFYIFAAVVLTGARILMTGGTLAESLILRITVSTVTALFVGFCSVMKNGFDTDSVLGAVTLILITPMLCYLYNGVYIYKTVKGFDSGPFRRKTVYLEAAAAAAGFSFIFSLKSIMVFGFSLSLVLSGLVTFAVSRARGPLYGAVCGLVCGLATGTAVNAVILGIIGFFSGLFFVYSTITAIMISFVAATGFLIYAGGSSSPGATVGDLLAAAALFLPISGFIPERQEVSAVSDNPQNEEGVRLANERLNSLADAFCSLSEVFYTVSDKTKLPERTDVGRMVSEVCDSVCSDCRAASRCWGREYGTTSDVTMKLAGTLLKKGSITAGDVGEHFKSKCIRLERFVDDINREFLKISDEYSNTNRTAVLAGQYSSLSRLLKTTACDFSRELTHNPEASKKAERVLKSLGISYTRVCAFGERSLMISCYGISVEKLKMTAADIARAFDERFQCRFAEPHFVADGAAYTMKLRRARRFTLECSHACLTKSGESVSGDSTAFFENDSDSFFALICDGMGSGRDAALTSRLAAIFIEKLMVSSGPKVVTLEMLNSFLLSRHGETFTTVDMLEIDLQSGKGNFIKAGAAPSFVIRSGSVYKISSNTPPAGIIGRMTAEQTGMQLEENDIVVMLSDGIADSAETSSWLPEMLTESEGERPAELAHRILREAKQRNGRADDMTIGVVLIKSA